MKLLLFFYCMSFRRASSQVEVLWEDHRNDLFINGFGAYTRFSLGLLRAYFPSAEHLLTDGSRHLWCRG